MTVSEINDIDSMFDIASHEVISLEEVSIAGGTRLDSSTVS